MTESTQRTDPRDQAVPALLDDRGHPSAPFDPYAHRPAWQRQRAHLLEDLYAPRCQSLLGALFFAVLVLVQSSAVFPLTAAVGLLILVSHTSALRKLPERAAGPYFLRYARCGSCRRRLPETPSPDGLHTCDHCGAAWHPDRFIDRDATLTSDEILLRLAAAPRHPALGLDLDDRGCPLPKLATAFPRDLNLRLMGGKRGARRAAMREIDAETRAIIIFAHLAILIAMTFLFVQDDGDGGRVWLWTFTALLVLAAIGSLFAPAFITREARRRAVEQGLCGGCGADLTHHRPLFDACIMCPACGRAWKAHKIKVPLLADREYPWREPPKPAPPAEPARRDCPRCGYDMTGLDKCPECAFPSKPPRTESRKGMFPMCARCGTALPGEHRMCPRCGIMAGVTWA